VTIEAATSKTVAEAYSHVPIGAACAAPSFFSTELHNAMVPDKTGMDPDPKSPEAPLFKLKVTQFPGGGTAIGMLAMHGVVDADALITFFKNWSRAFRGLEVEPTPNHDRTILHSLSTGSLPRGEKPAGMKARSVPGTEQIVPEFAPLMPKLMGKVAVCVPLPKARLQALAGAARAGLPDGAFVSDDDVVTACAWKALVQMRCGQVGLPADSEEVSTCSRAFNIRKRTEPPLGAAYFANAATQMWTELTVKEVCALSVSMVAQKLRASINAHSSEASAARIAWYHDQQERGCATPLVFDAKALTFIISSWMFDWEGVDFGAKPACFDHGAYTPVVCNFIPRAAGDGCNVYTSGPQESVELFACLLAEGEGA